jgi:hypothetical protein
VWVDEQDYVWIIHRGAAGLHNNERGAQLNPGRAMSGRNPSMGARPSGRALADAVIAAVAMLPINSGCLSSA